MTDETTGKTPLRRPTLGDVAQRANVSIMTVSNVIHAKTSRTGDETRARILAAIEEVGYRPNRRGRSLKMQREFAIGLTILQADRRFLDDPYLTEVAAGMSNALASSGYGLMVNGVVDIEGLREATAHANVDAHAVIASGPRADREAAYRLLARLHHPLVIVQDEPPGDLHDVWSILQEDGTGAGALTQAMLAAGALRLLFVAPVRIWPAAERREAACAAAARAGGARLARVACDETNFARSVEAIAAQIRATGAPDGIVATNDQLALAAIRAVRGLGLAVPSDVMVSGFNAFAFREFSSPLVNSMASPAYRIGEEAVRAILHRVETGRFEDRGVVLPVTPAPGETIR